MDFSSSSSKMKKLMQVLWSHQSNKNKIKNNISKIKDGSRTTTTTTTTSFSHHRKIIVNNNTNTNGICRRNNRCIFHYHNRNHHSMIMMINNNNNNNNRGYYRNFNYLNSYNHKHYYNNNNNNSTIFMMMNNKNKNIINNNNNNNNNNDITIKKYHYSVTTKNERGARKLTKKEMKTAISYGKELEYCIRERNGLHRTFEILDAIKENNMMDIYFVDQAIRCCAVNREWSTLLKIYHDIDIYEHITSKTPMTYKYAMEACVHAEQPWLALDIQQEMNRMDVPLDKYAYGLMIKALASTIIWSKDQQQMVSAITEANKLLLVMKRNNIQPDMISYHQLIHACTSTGLYTDSMNYMKMIENDGLDIDTVFYNTLLRGHIEKIDTAVKDFKKVNDINSINPLEINHFSIYPNQEDNPVHWLFDKIRKQTPRVFLENATKTMLQRCKYNIPSKEYKMIDKIVRIDYLNKRLFYLKQKSIAKNTQKVKEVHFALAKFRSENKNNNIPLSSSTYQLALSSFDEWSSPVDVIEGFESMRVEELEPNIKCYALALKACRSMKNIEKAELYMNELEATTQKDLKSLNSTQSKSLRDAYIDTINTLSANNDKNEMVLELLESIREQGLILQGEYLDDVLRPLARSSSVVLNKKTIDVATAQKLNGVRLEQSNYDLLFLAYRNLQAKGETTDFQDISDLLTTYKKEGFKANANTHHLISEVLDKHGKAELINELETNLINEPKVQQLYLLRKKKAIFSLEKGDWTRAMNILQEMRSGPVKPTEVIYNAVIDVLLRADEVKKAVELFQDMKIDGIIPSSYTYRLVLEASVLKEGRKRTEFVKNTRDAIEIFNNIRDAIEIFNEMKAQGLKATFSHYNILLDVLVKVNHYEHEARKECLKYCSNLFQEMLDNNVTMSEETWVLMMKINIGNGERDFYEHNMSDGEENNTMSKIVDLYENMKTSGVTPGIQSFIAFTNAYKLATDSDRQLANGALYEIITELKKRNAKSFGRYLDYKDLIDNLAKADKPDLGLEILEHIKVKGKFGKDVIKVDMYEELLESFSNNKYHMKKALPLMDEMLSNDISPTLRCYKALMKVQLVQHKHKQVVETFHKIFEAGLSPDQKAQNLAINACKAGGLNNELKTLWQSYKDVKNIGKRIENTLEEISTNRQPAEILKEIKDTLASILYDKTGEYSKKLPKLMSEIQRHQNGEGLILKVLGLCRKKNITLNNEIYQIVLKAMGNGTSYNKALEILGDMKMEGLTIGPEEYNAAAKVCMNAGMFGETENLHNEMQALGIVTQGVSNDEMINHLLNSDLDPFHLINTVKFVCDREDLERYQFILLLKVLQDYKISNLVPFILDTMKNRNLSLCLNTYNMALQVYAADSRWDQALRLLDEIKNGSNLNPDGVSYATVILACGQAGEWSIVQRLIEEISGLELLIDYPKLYYKMILACNTSNQWKTALDILNQIKKNRKLLSNEELLKCYSRVIAICTAAGQNQLAIDLYKETIEKELGSSEHAVVATIKALTNLERYQDAATCLYIYFRRGNKISHFSKNEICGAFVNCRDEKLVFNVLRGFEKFADMKHDKTTQAALLRILTLNESWEEVDRILKVVQRKKNEKDSKKATFFYNTVMNACDENKNYSEAIEYFNRIEDVGLKQNFESYKTAVSVCRKLKLTQQAKKIFDDLLTKEEFKPDADMYDNYIELCMETGDFEAPLDLMPKIKKDRVTLSSKSYSSLIEASANKKLWEQAYSILEGVVFLGDKKFEDSQTYSLAMESCQKLEHFQSTIDLFQDMKDAGITPTIKNYRMAMDACASTGLWQRALTLVEDMENEGLVPDADVYNEAVMVCTDARNDIAINGLLQRMEDKNLDLNNACYNRLLPFYERESDWESISKLSSKMYHRGADVGLRRFDAMLYDCMNHRDWQKTLKIIEKMKQQGIKIQPSCYISAVRTCALAGKINITTTLVNEMKSMGYEIDTDTKHVLESNIYSGFKKETFLQKKKQETFLLNILQNQESTIDTKSFE